LGKVNNIDIRQNVQLGGDRLDILGGSNRSDNSLIIYAIDSLGQLQNLLTTNHIIDTNDIDEVYGFCMYKDKDNHGHAIVNGKNGKINQYQISKQGNQVSLSLINSWQLESQPEGMVADDKMGTLFIGEEEKGIWKLSLTDPDQQITLLPDSQKENNPSIEYDIEGLSIFYGNQEHEGFLLASIQGSFSYAVFDLQDNHYLGSFVVNEQNGIDGVEETDGLDISAKDFGGHFSEGILVVQDGFNYTGTTMIGQNFKFIPLRNIFDIVSSFRKKDNLEL
jgi:3-phytase